MDTLKVDIDPVGGQICIYNNGRGIPVEIHVKEGIWVPELIFGHLLTSSNYNDDQKRLPVVETVTEPNFVTFFQLNLLLKRLIVEVARNLDKFSPITWPIRPHQKFQSTQNWQ